MVSEIQAVIATVDPLDLIACLAFENLSYSTGSNHLMMAGKHMLNTSPCCALRPISLSGMIAAFPPRRSVKCRKKSKQYSISSDSGEA